IQCLAIEPQGRLLAVGSWGGDTTVSIWDLKTQRKLVSPKHDLANPKAVAFSPDGKYFVASGNGLKLWKIERSRDESGDEHQRLIFVVPQGEAQVWDAPAHKLLSRIGRPGEFKGPYIALSADGKLLAAPGEPRAMSIWDTSSRKLLFLFRAELSQIWSLAWSR